MASTFSRNGYRIIRILWTFGQKFKIIPSAISHARNNRESLGIEDYSIFRKCLALHHIQSFINSQNVGIYLAKHITSISSDNLNINKFFNLWFSGCSRNKSCGTIVMPRDSQLFRV